MKISILCSSVGHPVNVWLERWVSANGEAHSIELVRKKSGLSGGDLLFLISCGEILKKNDRAAYKKCLVIHASDLPRGRGWSPHIWQIIEGKTMIDVSLIEAEDKVDTGDIWHQVSIEIPKHYLYDEINEAIFDAEIELMNFAVSNFDTVIPKKQSETKSSTYYPLRHPDDSILNPSLSIEKQFDLIRVCDPNRFPAFFELRGEKYKIRLEKVK